MKRLFLMTIIAFVAGASKAQNYDDKQNIKVEVEQDAHYPKGEMALYQYIFKNIKYNEDSKANKAEGQVMVSFNVYPDSTVNDVVIISGLGYNIDDEVKRLLKELKFAPAIQNGEKAKMNLMFNLPVRAH